MRTFLGWSLCSAKSVAIACSISCPRTACEKLHRVRREVLHRMTWKGMTWLRGEGHACRNEVVGRSSFVRRLPMNLMMSTRQVDGVTIVDMKGRIILGEESAALRSLVFDLLKEGHRKILFNLRDVDYIDSSGLGHL